MMSRWITIQSFAPQKFDAAQLLGRPRDSLSANVLPVDVVYLGSQFLFENMFKYG